MSASTNMEHASSSASEASKKGSQMFGKVVDSIVPTVTNAYHETEDALSEALETGTKTIKKYPMESILIGFGLGCLAGVAYKTLSK